MNNTILYTLIFSLIIGMGGAVSAQEDLLVRKVNKSSRNHYARNFHVVIGGGYAYRLGKDYDWGDKGLNEFVKSLRNGYGVNLDVQYLFQENWGLGIHTDFVRQHKRYPGTLHIEGVAISNYEESNDYLFIGPSFVYRLQGKKMGYFFDIGWGPEFYTNTAKASDRHGQFKKTVFASYVSALAEYKLSPSIGLGAKVSITGGSFKDDTLLGKAEKFSVTNLMISGIVTFTSKNIKRK